METEHVGHRTGMHRHGGCVRPGPPAAAPAVGPPEWELAAAAPRPAADLPDQALSAARPAAPAGSTTRHPGAGTAKTGRLQRARPPPPRPAGPVPHGAARP